MVSIITPAHNEEEIISQFVENAVSFLKRKKISGEVIVVENGSTDKTVEILRKYKNIRVINLPFADKGLALRSGLEAAKGDKLITLDVDLWDENFVEDSIKHLDTFDVVVGSKFINGSSDQRPFFRKIISLLTNFAFRLLFDFKGTDSKAKLSFNKKSILPLVNQCKTKGLIFDTELIIRGEKAGLKKVEVPMIVRELRPKRFSTSDQIRKILFELLVLIKSLGLTPNWRYVAVFIALIIGVFIRFYHYKDFLFFQVDEEHYAYMTRMIVVNRHFPLIGGPISGTRLYMAPWFLYFSAIWFWLSNNSVVFTGMVFAGFGLMTSFVIYLIGKQLFSAKAATISFILYSCSFFVALFDRHYWNLTLIPFLSALAVYFLIKRRIILLGLIVGFGLSNSFSMMAVFLFVLLALLIKRKKDVLVFITIVALMHFTLIIFDVRHNFWLLRALGDFFVKTSTTEISLLSRISSTFGLLLTTLGKSLAIIFPIDISRESSICANVSRYTPNILLTIFAAGVLIWYFLQKKNYLLWIPGILLIVNFGSLFIFRGDGSERHFLPFVPIFIVLVGGFLSKLNNKITTLVVIVFASVNLLAFSQSWASHGYSAKEKVVKSIISNTNPREFRFNVSGGSCYSWGYRYLFSYFHHEPASSYLDYDFAWMYDVAPKLNDVKKTITINAF